MMWWYFLRTVVDKHYCGGLLCLMWWVIMLDVVVCFAYCGGIFCVLWWVTMLVVVVVFAYCGGYEIIAKVYRSSKKNHKIHHSTQKTPPHQA